MSAALEAFDELVIAIGDEFNGGTPYIASVGNTLNKDCIPTEIPSDHSPGAGGFSEQGTMQIQMRVSDFASLLTRQDEGVARVVCKGKALTLLSFTETGGVYTITAGDVTAGVTQ